MKLEKLFESLDEKVFTPELKDDLQKTFDTAVAEASKINEDTINEKVETLAEIKAVEMIAEQVEEKISELEEKAEDFQAILEKEAKEKEAELLEQVDLFLEKIVDEFLEEASEKLDESVKAEKADMIIEAMDAMIVATGTDILKIKEAKDDSDAELKLAESIEKYDKLLQENLALEKEKANMMKMGLIAEMKDGMSSVDAEKFDAMANLVEFDMSESYINKLETIKENLGTSKAKKPDEVKIDKKVNERIDEKIEKTVPKANITTAFSHLI